MGESKGRRGETEESTWDLVIFVGTGALGPLGSAQTVLLAIVNVAMQLLVKIWPRYRAVPMAMVILLGLAR